MSGRRGFLALAAGAVAASALPLAALAAARPDAALIALCNGHAAKLDAFHRCGLDSGESPAWPPYEASIDAIDAIDAAQLTSVAALIALAKAAEAEADMQDGRLDWTEGCPPDWAAKIAQALASGRIAG